MNDDNPIGIIELGNKNFTCLIFKTNKDKKIEVLSTSITASDGIYNDVVLNLKKASNAIRLAISTAEKKAKITLKKINVVFEQTDFLCTRFSKHKKIDGSKIHRNDIEFLLKEAKKQLIHNDKNQSIIHIFNHNYVVDGKIFIEEPINVFADNLTHEMTFVTTPKNNLKNINQVFFDCDIEIEKFFSRTFTLAVNLLTHNNLQAGCILINLESMRTSLGFFKNLALIHTTSIPIGTDYFIRDISQVCSLTQKESQLIIKNIDFSFKNTTNLFDKDNYLKDDFFIDSNIRKISKDLIFDIVKERLDEIFELLKKSLKTSGFNLNSGINIVLNGETSNFLNIQLYCESFFGLNVTTKDLPEIDKNFAACLGCAKIIKDGWETEAIPVIKEKNLEKMGFFKRIFTNF